MKSTMSINSIQLEYIDIYILNAIQFNSMERIVVQAKQFSNVRHVTEMDQTV